MDLDGFLILTGIFFLYAFPLIHWSNKKQKKVFVEKQKKKKKNPRYATLPWNAANNSALCYAAFQNLSNRNCDIITLQIMGTLRYTPAMSLIPYCSVSA